MRGIRKYYSELKKYKKMCGMKGIPELAVDPAMQPEGCKLETPIRCQRRANRSIDVTVSNCHLRAQKHEKFCD